MKITVTFGPEGGTSIEVDGVQGPSCTDYIDDVLRELSATEKKETKKKEYYAGEKVKSKTKG